jgi:phosphoribosylglycinamide formyltransferase-1
MALSIVVLISGKGSNLRAILEAIDAGTCNADVRAVISDRDSAEGLALARSRGVETAVVALKAYPDRAQWNDALRDRIASFEPALVVLAGFMKLLGAGTIDRFAGRILNVHPSLLPLFPGVDGPAQAIAARVRVSGCTVHVVDHGVDTGPIVAQAVVPVLAGDDVDRLHQRIQRAEHRLLPAVIDAVARGDVALAPQLRVADAAFDAASVLYSPRLGLPPS